MTISLPSPAGLWGYFSYDYLGYSEPSVRAEVEDSGISLWFNHSYTKTAAEDTKSTGRNTYLMRLAKMRLRTAISCFPPPTGARD